MEQHLNLRDVSGRALAADRQRDNAAPFRRDALKDSRADRTPW